MTAPRNVQIVHPGWNAPDGPQCQRIARWLKANGIDSNRVSAHDAITVHTIPQIEGEPDRYIAYTEHYVTPDGDKERNRITDQPVQYQRTVPLRVPYEEPGADA